MKGVVRGGICKAKVPQDLEWRNFRHVTEVKGAQARESAKAIDLVDEWQTRGRIARDTGLVKFFAGNRENCGADGSRSGINGFREATC